MRSGGLAVLLAALVASCSLRGLSYLDDRFDAAAPVESGAADGAASAYAAAVLADGPLAFWRLGEPAGAITALDATGHGHDGTYVGPPALGQPGALAGDRDTSARFGPSTYVTMGDQFAFTRAAFSIELWIRVLALSPNLALFLSKGDYAHFTGGYTFTTSTAPSGAPSVAAYFWFDGGANNNLTKTQPPPSWVGAFTYFVFSFDGKGKAAFYLDCALTAPPGTIVPFDSSPQIPFTLSTPDGDALHGGTWFTGDLDEVAVYDRVLDPAAIARHYLAATGRVCP